jgi:hypothetical protein
MQVRLTKPWTPLTPEAVARLPGQLGVYEIAEASGQVLFIGVAGGHSHFGLRGELERELERRGAGLRFRIEVNMQYLSRYRELLMVHRADHGCLPAENEPAPGLGRLSPA